MDNKKFYNNIMKSILIEKMRYEEKHMKPTHITMNIFTLKELSKYLEFVMPAGDLRYCMIHGLQVIYSDNIDKNKLVIGFECGIIDSE